MWNDVYVLWSAGRLFADGGRTKRALRELQSAAMGRRRTARFAEPQKLN